MSISIFEIKSRCSDPTKIRDILKARKAFYKGKDLQIDTYFNVSSGRLKLREGKIENNLIYYDREDKKGPKRSFVNLYTTDPVSSLNLKALLSKALGVLVEVEKQREIYFVENVKFHVDIVKNLGSFVEIEAIDRDGSIGVVELKKQCKYFLNLFKIPEKDLISHSYSDLLLQLGRHQP
ncbi:class IV adenylate cyclase [Acidobacteriota bacterium]